MDQYHRRVKERRLYKASNTLESKTLLSVPTSDYNDYLSPVEVKRQDAAGRTLSVEKHYYSGTPYRSAGYTYFSRPYPFWRDGLETKTEYFAGDGVTFLKTIEQFWEQRRPTGATGNPSGNPLNDIPNGARVMKTRTTLADVSPNLVSETVISYNDDILYKNLPINRVKDVFEYDFGDNTPGGLLRTTHTDYVTDPTYVSYAGAYLINLPSQKWVSSDDSGGYKASLTEFEYDNYTDANHAPLLDRTNVAGHDTINYGSNSVKKRGNLTKIKIYGNAQSQTEPVSIYSQFDILGNVVKTIDGKGYSSTIDYADRFGLPDNEARSNSAPTQLNGQQTFAFQTSSTNALNWTTDYVQYDYYSGKPINTEDLGGVISKIVYEDAFDRVTQTVSAVSTPFERQTNINYHDYEHRVETRSDLNTLNDNLLKSESFYDGLGRNIESRKYEAVSGGYTAIKTEYDGLGRAKKATNPYRPTEISATNPILWSENFYDPLGRIIKVKGSDNSEVILRYDGNAMTVTDQSGKARRSITNAVGQVIRVDEPTEASGLGEINTPNQPTYYTYDVLTNLISVQQSGGNAVQCGAISSTCSQTRTFVYDSLSRLKSVTNPELGTTAINGTTAYNYDNNGNLINKTDPRGVTTTYTYDNLNRITARSYSAPQNLPNYQVTPDTTYTYDNLPNAKGRLTKVSNGSSTTEYQVFDVLGRVTQSQQTTDGVTYGEPMTYKYDLSGSLIEEKYPSGRVVRNVLDNNGNLAMVQSKKNASSGYFNYAKNFTYTAIGAVSSMQLGNGRWESAQFNSRLQLTQIALGTVQNGTDKLKINFDYGSQNNGNVLSQTINVPTVGTNQGFMATQTYTYDSLNRLKDAKELIGATQSWKQTYQYDRFGNRQLDAANTTTIPANCATAVCNPQIDPATNRLVGYQFDNAGNIKVDAEGRQFIYNAENKQTKVTNSTQTLGVYSYDGDNRRVKKYIPSTDETTIFIYDATGEIVAEYTTLMSSTPQVNYLTSDHLGSPRINTDANGQVVARHDYQPFGEEVATTQRNQYLEYQADTVRNRFTGYQKDLETDLDFAQARFYSSKFGRFNSPDKYNPFLNLGNSNAAQALMLSQPQSWNKYQYAFNNPLKFIDHYGKNPALAILSVVVVAAAVTAIVVGGPVVVAVGIGILVGGGINTAVTAIRQLKSTGTLTDRNNELTGAFLGGALAGGVVALTGGTTAAILGGGFVPILTRTAVNAGVGTLYGAAGQVAGGEINRSATNRPTTSGDVATDAISGAGGGFVGGSVTGFASRGMFNLSNNSNSFLSRTFNQTVPNSLRNTFLDAAGRAQLPTYNNYALGTIGSATTQNALDFLITLVRAREPFYTEVIGYDIEDPEVHPHFWCKSLNF